MRRCRTWWALPGRLGSAGLGGPAGVPDEALPDLVGAAGPAGLRLRVGLPAFPMRRCRTWWALPGRLGSANGRDAFYCFARPTGSRSKTEFIDFAGRRARTVPAGGLLFPDFQVCGSRSKTEFFGFAGRRARTAPAGGLLFPDFQVCGSRSKTEFFGFPGRRARTGPASKLIFPDFQVCGSRSKTEFIDFADRRARTAPVGGLRSDEKRCTEGSAGLRASLPTIIFPKGKN